MFSDVKLNKLRNGVRVNMKEVRLWAEVINRQNTNTWLHIKTDNNSILEIRHVFRKLSLRVNRLVRTQYGPFGLNQAKSPGDFTELSIPKSISNILFYRYKEKLNRKLKVLDDSKLELIRQKIADRQRHEELIEIKPKRKYLEEP